jgi:hypothetical protein
VAQAVLATVIAMSSSAMAHPSLEDYVDHHTPNIGLAPGTPLVSYPVWQTGEIEKQARKDWWALKRRYEARQRRLEREREARQAEAAEAAVPEVSASVDWYAIAACESSGDWTIASGNGYYGGLQILLSTWNAYGGQEFASYPHLASVEAQIAVAERILDGQGIGAWPVCGAYG